MTTNSSSHTGNVLLIFLWVGFKTTTCPYLENYDFTFELVKSTLSKLLRHYLYVNVNYIFMFYENTLIILMELSVHYELVHCWSLECNRIGNGTPFLIQVVI